jgi:hypothetical protein
MNLHSIARSRFMPGAALALGGVLVFVLAAFTPGATAQDKKPNKFVGAAKCKSCHGSDETGNQHAAWMKMAHAKAFASLATEEAKKAGATKNIADPQKDDACLKCHVTGHGAPPEQLGKGFDFKAGVQCESCHGPGETHIKKRMAAAAKAEEGAPVVLEEGELVAITPQTCTKCHNSESPTFKPFCYFKRREETKHLNPKAKRSEDDTKRLELVCGCGDKCPTDKCVTGECGVPKSK